MTLIQHLLHMMDQGKNNNAQVVELVDTHG